MKVESCIIVDSTSFGPRKKSGQEKKFLGLVQIESKAIESKAIHENKAIHDSKAIREILVTGKTLGAVSCRIPVF